MLTAASTTRITFPNISRGVSRLGPQHLLHSVSMEEDQKGRRCIPAFWQSKGGSVANGQRKTAFLHADGSINRAAFGVRTDLVALRVPTQKLNVVSKTLRPYLLDVLRTKRVVADSSASPPNSSKLVLCNERVRDGTLADIPADVLQPIKDDIKGIVRHELSLGYENLTAEDVFAMVLPEDVDNPSSFETVGHVAHLNLREGQLPYKKLIGEVLLDKNPAIKTVVNKTSTIETEFRTFPMELLAGESNTLVEVKECGAKYKFDFAEVYWNSRLQYEHQRLVDEISQSKGTVVCDMMCGIGPFAIPLGLRGCIVHANDLNPKSYEYLVQNIKLNKVSKQVQAYNMDGRAFVHHLLAQGVRFNRIIMNLPATAIEFLDVFKSLFDDSWTALPTVHCYCFSRHEKFLDVLQRIEEILDCQLGQGEFHVHDVRDVAPNKRMLCVSFKLPDTCRASRHHLASRSPKRRRTDSGSTS